VCARVRVHVNVMCLGEWAQLSMILRFQTAVGEKLPMPEAPPTFSKPPPRETRREPVAVSMGALDLQTQILNAVVNGLPGERPANSDVRRQSGAFVTHVLQYPPADCVRRLREGDGGGSGGEWEGDGVWGGMG
jgi:hypothetical protein